MVGELDQALVDFEAADRILRDFGPLGSTVIYALRGITAETYGDPVGAEAARRRQYEILDEAGLSALSHLAFFQAPVHQRLYLDPVIELGQYVELWQGSGGERIGGYWEEELRTSLWPWLKEQGCATAADDPVFREFLQLLGGKRQSHLRPSLRAERVWPAEEVVTADIRAEINRVLQAIGEPSLPV